MQQASIDLNSLLYIASSSQGSSDHSTDSQTPFGCSLSQTWGQSVGGQEELVKDPLLSALCQLKYLPENVERLKHLQLPVLHPAAKDKLTHESQKITQVDNSIDASSNSSLSTNSDQLAIQPIPVMKLGKNADATSFYQLGQMRYLLSPHLLKGSFGKFRLGYCNQDKLVGIKVLRLQAKADRSEVTKPVTQDQIWQEITLQNTYGRANKVTQIWTHKAKWMLVMPVFDGSLIEWMNLSAWRHAVPQVRQSIARALIRSVGAQLQQMHQAGVIHRDIKPDNILVDRLLGMELCDFGLATCLQGEHSIAGTMDFFAPELFLPPNSSSSKASDVWSLGMTVLSVLGGQVFSWPNMVGITKYTTKAEVYWNASYASRQLGGYFEQLRKASTYVDVPGKPQSWKNMMQQAFATDKQLTNWLLQAMLLGDPQQRIGMDQMPDWLTSPANGSKDVQSLLQQIYQNQLNNWGSMPDWLFNKQWFMARASQYMR